MKTKQPRQIRQGDVFIEISTVPLPSAAQEIPMTGRIVLALGEVTGHAHAIYPTDETKELPAKLWDAGAERFLQVLTRCLVQHEEHAPLCLEPGIYRVSKFGVGTQREYSPQALRSVAD